MSVKPVSDRIFDGLLEDIDEAHYEELPEAPVRVLPEDMVPGGKLGYKMPLTVEWASVPNFFEKSKKKNFVVITARKQIEPS